MGNYLKEPLTLRTLRTLREKIVFIFCPCFGNYKIHSLQKLKAEEKRLFSRPLR
jgi:hypothetical protein